MKTSDSQLDSAPIRIGIAEWQEGDAIASEGEKLLRALGREPVLFSAQRPPPPGLDAVFVTGPFGSMTPLGKYLESLGSGERPRLVWFITEQLPDPQLPRRSIILLGRLRSAVERAAYRRSEDGGWRLRTGWSGLTRYGHRFRYAGDAEWLREAGLLDLLVTGSPWRAEQLRGLGHDPLVVPSPSYYPGWGADLGLDRDIPVLWIGKTGSRRRLRLLDRLEADLERRGIPLLRIDGIEQPYVFGEARTRLLNRTKIVVNLLRARWDNNAMRYALAAQNGALLVSEPALPHTGFIPGKHFIEVPVGQMADRIASLLDDEVQRREIADRALAEIRKASKLDVYARVCSELERRSETPGLGYKLRQN